METPVSISVGSRGTLISLIDRELELLHAEKMCCCSPHTSPNPNPNPTRNVFASVPASPSSSSSAFRSSSTLWHDLKSLLLSKSPPPPTTTSPHYGSRALFCKGAALDPSEAAAHETCHLPSPDPRRRRPGGLTRQGSSTRQHHSTSDLCSTAESVWWGKSNNMLGGKKEKKKNKGKNAKSNALAKLVRLDREAEGEEDGEVPWHGAEEEEEESEFMVKPMLERFHYNYNYYDRRFDGSRNRSPMEARVSSAATAASYRISNANVVDLQCCSSACEATIAAPSSSSPLPKRFGSSFTRLSAL